MEKTYLAALILVFGITLTIFVSANGNTTEGNVTDGGNAGGNETNGTTPGEPEEPRANKQICCTECVMVHSAISGRPTSEQCGNLANVDSSLPYHLSSKCVTYFRMMPKTISSCINLISPGAGNATVIGGNATFVFPEEGNATVIMPGGSNETLVVSRGSNATSISLRGSNETFVISGRENATFIVRAGSNETLVYLNYSTGGESNATVSGGLNFTVSVPGLNSTENGTIIAYYGKEPVIELNFTTSSGELNLSQIRVELNETYVIVNTGDLLSNNTKTVYIHDKGFVRLCAKDADIESIDEVSESCSGAYEVDLTACLSNPEGIKISNLVCYDEGSRIRVENLGHSALRGFKQPLTTTPDAPAPAAKASADNPLALYWPYLAAIAIIGIVALLLKSKKRKSSE